jgi:hypothetical protein
MSFVLLSGLLLADTDAAVGSDDEERLAQACQMTVPELKKLAEGCERNKRRATQELSALIRREYARLADLKSPEREEHQQHVEEFARSLAALKSGARVAPPELVKLATGEVGALPKNEAKIVHVIDRSSARIELSFRSGTKREVLITGVTTKSLAEDTTITVPYCYRVVETRPDSAAGKGKRTIPVLELFDTRPLVEYLRLKHAKSSVSKPGL